MEIRVFDTKQELGRAAAERAKAAIGEAVARSGEARVIAATGASQFEFLDALTSLRGIDWGRVEMFHLDEYVGVPDTHPASFRRYLRERIVERVKPRVFHFLAGDAPDPAEECRRVGALLARAPIDVAFVGIGENGHLAFNDPGVADFDDPLDVKVVTLDDACRRQQVGEGHFPDLDAVPAQAMTVTIPALLRAAVVLAIVPEGRKAQAVHDALTDPVSTACPASVLRTRDGVVLHLDLDSSAELVWS